MESKPLILIVDDNLQNIQVLGSLLDLEGIDTAAALSAEQAFHFIETVLPDLILLDIMMPGMSGIEMCKLLKRTPRTASIPIIFLSAKSETENIVEGFEVGGADYVTKPFNPAILKVRINYQLQLIKYQNELRHLIEQLDMASRTDPLTSLPNRRAMYEKLNHEMNRFQRSDNAFSLILIDIDFFKSFNDTYGHETGDYVLVEVSNLLRQNVRKQDLVARWGGEEFLIVLVDTEIGGAFEKGERIRKIFESTLFHFKGIQLKITITLGCSQIRSETIENCIRRADDALYRGKENGRNRIEKD